MKNPLDRLLRDIRALIRKTGDIIDECEARIEEPWYVRFARQPLEFLPDHMLVAERVPTARELEAWFAEEAQGGDSQ